jgi:Fe-S cluster assembly protein SufB
MPKPTPKPSAHTPFENLNRETFDHHDPSGYMKKFRKGLSRELVEAISQDKNEPAWMLEHRLKAYDHFLKMAMPKWGPSLKALDFDEICFFAKAADKKGGYQSWAEVPDSIKNTFERLGIPEAERSVLAGVGAQYESESIYHSLEKELIDLGVIFCDLDIAVQDHPDLVRQHFMKVVPDRKSVV